MLFRSRGNHGHGVALIRPEAGSTALRTSCSLHDAAGNLMIARRRAHDLPADVLGNAREDALQVMGKRDVHIHYADPAG